MNKYALQQQKHEHKGLLTKYAVLHVEIPSTTTQPETKRVIAKIPSLTCVYSLYNNTDINRKVCCQNNQYYICTYTLQKKHKQKGFFPKEPALHV